MEQTPPTPSESPADGADIVLDPVMIDGRLTYGDLADPQFMARYTASQNSEQANTSLPTSREDGSSGEGDRASSVFHLGLVATGHATPLPRALRPLEMHANDQFANGYGSTPNPNPASARAARANTYSTRHRYNAQPTSQEYNLEHFNDDLKDLFKDYREGIKAGNRTYEEKVSLLQSMSQEQIEAELPGIVLGHDTDRNNHIESYAATARELMERAATTAREELAALDTPSEQGRTHLSLQAVLDTITSDIINSHGSASSQMEKKLAAVQQRFEQLDPVHGKETARERRRLLEVAIQPAIVEAMQASIARHNINHQETSYSLNLLTGALRVVDSSMLNSCQRILLDNYELRLGQEFQQQRLHPDNSYEYGRRVDPSDPDKIIPADATQDILKIRATDPYNLPATVSFQEAAESISKLDAILFEQCLRARNDRGTVDDILVSASSPEVATAIRKYLYGTRTRQLPAPQSPNIQTP